MTSIEKQSLNPAETHNSNSHLLTNNTDFPEMIVLGEFVAYFSVSGCGAVDKTNHRLDEMQQLYLFMY